EQSCDLARAADVFNTVLSRKPEITVKPVPQRISVQQDHLPSLVEQRALHLTRDGRLSGAGNACEPNDSGLVAVAGLALLTRDVPPLPRDVGRHEPNSRTLLRRCRHRTHFA